MLKELVGSGHVEAIDEDLFLPANSDSKPSESRAEAIISFGPKMNALGSTLIRNLISSPESGLFESLAVASQVAPNLSPKISRELERRCRTFTQSIDRYLMDQQLNDEELSEIKHHSLGVIVAVVERSPEKEIPKRRRGKK
jgi:hypothetical protein